ncbi:hypothetical protein AAFC00_005616 [Neodothiora populina]|uniref:Sulfate transporter family protein n=1 Tax=Neodothiora populina TaxID=2781224 RepID=A0ABR3PLH9_9PEZI
MSRLFKGRRGSAASQQQQQQQQPQQQQLPFTNNDVQSADFLNDADTSATSGSAVIDAAPANLNTNRGRSSSILSSSYKTPARSYIHHAGHGHQEPVHYSSTGVREQTAELSSSFLSESDMHSRFPKRFSQDSQPAAFRRSLDSNPSSRHSQDFSPAPNRSSVASDTAFDAIERGKRGERRPTAIVERPEPVSPEESLTQQSPPHVSKLSELLSDGETPPQSRDGPTASTPPRARPQSMVPSLVVSEADSDAANNATETSPLLGRRPNSFQNGKSLDGGNDEVDNGDNLEQDDVERQSLHRSGTWRTIQHAYPSLRKLVLDTYHTASHPKSWDVRSAARIAVVKPAMAMPAVFLGVLLNLLDALSYGIILFPLGEEVFSGMGADGVSMFYVSCIVAQLVYSSGSIFRGGVGSEMIEVVPFFHKMTYMIIGSMGDENPDALRATVIVSYAMSSILTGVVFFGLGSARLGTLVNFFPHSILTGCIGGVGIFLFVTGIEVSARLPGNFEFTAEVFSQLFEADTVVLWLPPLGLAIILLTVKHFYDRPWLVPAYYIGITVLFYIVVAATPKLSLDTLRGKGWIFEAPAAGVAFYNFYSYYKFSLVDWDAIWATVPTQFALTFFGILHVPINVPNLAMVVQEDNVSVNRELIMHGLSNTLSGCLGSIQNYLVFVNSVLFINTGGDTRLAGYMLALATFGLWVAGPVVIGYVPVMVVGTLIYMLGIELAMEAMVTTYGRLHRLEYFTIVAIAIVMGFYDFVVGIAIGIGLACLVYVVQTSRRTVIRAEFSGAVAESTVRRHPRQREYLHRAGSQVRVIKLGGYLFFGSIVKVEKKVRALIDSEAFAATPIRYLILDFDHVTGIDFSAAEAFGRMNRILHRRDVRLALAGVTLQSEVGESLQMVGLFTESDDDDAIPSPKVFESLNDALESCENELLIILNERHDMAAHHRDSQVQSMGIPIATGNDSSPAFDMSVGSPRRNFLVEAATTTISEHRNRDSTRWRNFKQPLPLILQAFQGVTDKNEDFWFRAVSYFERKEYLRGKVLYSRGDEPDGFYLLQSGILRADYDLDQGNYHESIVAGTTCGELPFFSETNRTGTVVAELDCVAWLLTPDRWASMQKDDQDVAAELLKVGMKLSAERMNAITSYVLITAS